MAKSGTIIKYFYTKSPSSTTASIIATTSNVNSAVFSLSLNWEVQSQDIITNTSNIKWSLTASEVDFSKIDADTNEFTTPAYIGFGTDDLNISKPYNDIEVKIGSSVVYTTTTLDKSLLKGGTVEISSGSDTVTHASNGSYSATISANVRIRNIYDTSNNPAFRYYSDVDFGPGTKADISGTMTLDSIPRKAVITAADDFYDEQSPTMEFIIPNTASSVQVGISFDGTEMNIPYRAINKTATSYTFNFTGTEMNTLISYLRSSGVPTDDGLAAPVRFYILTDGQTDYVTRTATLIDYTPYLEPEVTADATSVNLTGSDQTIIKYITKASYNVNALGRKGASITSYAVKNGDLTLGTATGIFDGATSGDFYFTITDSYGYTSRRLVELDLIEYIKVTCSASVGEMTADGDISVTISGNYFNSTFGKVQNNLSLYYKVTKKNGGSTIKDWHVITPTISGGKYSYTFLITDLDYQSVYDLVIEVKDKAMPSPAHTETILASTPIFDWGRNDFNFNVPVSFNNVPMVDFIVENGVSGNWTYRKWNSGLMECWGFIKGTVDVMTQWGGVYRSNTTIQDYFPVSFVNYPIVQATPSYDNYGNYWLATFSTQSGMNRTPSYQICLGENAVNVNYKISFYAIGK